MPTAAKKRLRAAAILQQRSRILLRPHARPAHGSRRRIDGLRCTENSPEAAELAAIIDVIEVYERQWWPLGEITRRQEG